MTSTAQYDSLKDQRAKLTDSVLSSLSPQTLADPNVVNRLKEMYEAEES